MLARKFNLEESEIQKFEVVEEKKGALENLILVSENNELLRNEELYQRFLKDYGVVQNDRSELWDRIIKKYGLSDDEQHVLLLDFENKQVIEQLKE